MTLAYFTASSTWRAFAACHSSSSTMRSSGTSVVIHLSRGLMRETRLPVAGCAPTIRIDSLARHLPADQAGDRQHRRVDPNRCISIAIVIRCRRRCVVGRAILVLDHRRPRPGKFRSRDRVGLETACDQCQYSIHISSLQRTTGRDRRLGRLPEYSGIQRTARKIHVCLSQFSRGRPSTRANPASLSVTMV